jgi:peptide/nickel transport system permease protein
VNARQLLAVMLLGTIGMLVLVIPAVSSQDPHAAAPTRQLESPSAAHPLGTDLLGRDVLTRLAHGGRRTLGVGLLSLGITLLPGLAIGLAAGFVGNLTDWALMALMDALLAFPSLLLALALIALSGSGPVQVAVAIGVAGIAAYARVTRAAVRDARTRAYVIAARALGAGPARIICCHILPTIAPTLLAFAGVTLSWALINGAALTFLGYGGDISTPDWGIMLSDGRSVFRTAPWVALAPGITLSLSVFAINLLVNSLAKGRPGS